MKHLCYSKLWILLFIIFNTSLFASSSLEKKSAMFYYGDDISWSLVGIHDYIIVQPEHIDTATHGFKLYKDNIYAYVSIGEAEKGQSSYETISKKWTLGKNKAWNSKVIDISSEDYHKFLFENVIDPLIKRGFKNFFWDTLDSYQIVAKTKEDKERMRQGLLTLVKTFHKRYPNCKLILNRGFEIVDEVHNMIEAVAIESLFWGMSGTKLKYSKVSKEDREWLIAQIKKIKSYNLEVIVVDYSPFQEKRKIEKTIASIEEIEAIPYIGDRHLMRFGYSSKNAVKREVLLLYDDTEFDGTEDDDKIYSTAFHQLSMPLEYMGYIPVLKPVTQCKFREDDLDRYAGARVWLSGTYAVKHPQQFTKQIKSLYGNNINC